MNASVETINTVQRRVKVEVPVETVNAAFDSAFKKIQKKVQLQGFRPGKAPLAMIKKLYGDQIAGEVTDKLINGNLFEVLKNNNIRPVSSPVVDSNEIPSRDKAFNFSAVVDVMPDVEVNGYKNLKIAADKFEVNDTAIEAELRMLRRRNAKSRSLDAGTPAAKGHLVSLGHKALLDGAELSQFDVEDMEVQLGEKELLDQLEEHLYGMKAGEQKVASVVLPDNYGDTELRAKTLEFHINMKDVKDLVLPEFNDEFAKDIGEESAAKVRSDVEKSLNVRMKQMRRQQLETRVLEALHASNNFDVPPSMVDTVIDSMIREFNIQDPNQLKGALHNAKLRESLLPTAKRKAQNTLMLWRIAQAEDLQVNDSDVKQFLLKEFEQFDSKDGTKTRDDAEIDRLVAQYKPKVQDHLIFEKTMDFLINNAQLQGA